MGEIKMNKHAKEWLIKARERSEKGILNEMVSTELFDHTWMASVYQIQKNLRLADGQKVLEAGCGWGRLIFGLKYFHRSLTIDGYELTPEFVNKAREILSQNDLHHGVRIMQGDLLDVEIARDHYDSFYSSRVLHYIERKGFVIEKLYQSLKEGGRGMIILPNKFCPYRWFTYKHAPLYSITSIGEIMNRIGFTHIYYGGYGFLPGNIRFSHNSIVPVLDRYLSLTPLRKFAGLVYVVGQK